MTCLMDQELLSLIGAECGPDGVAGIPQPLEFTGVTQDSRNVAPGSLFVAVRGRKVDGHLYAAGAAAAGAVAVVCEDRAAVGEIDVPVIVVPDARRALALVAARIEGDPSRYFSLTGVIGTDGKTSTSMIIEAGMIGCGFVTGLLGTVHYSCAGQTFKSNMTTPDQVALQRLFSRMRNSGVEAVVMEVSSHAIDQRRVEGCHFVIGVFTNLGRDHLDYHETPEAYRDAKLRFFTEVLPSSPHARGAVVNDDDPVSAIIRRECPLNVIGWSINNCRESEIRALNVRYSFAGTEFDVVTPWGQMHVSVPLIGRHNVANILAAIGVAGMSGWDLKAFVKGIGSLTVIPGRLESVPSKRSVKVFVDYAHTPRAIESVLAILRGIDPGARLHIVCGAGGDRDSGKRPIMGRAAVTGADVAWITSDNPRSEDPNEIIRQVVGGIEQAVADGEKVGEWHVEPDRRMAITSAIRNARDNDVILVAGKGHESCQILRDRTIHFSDVEVAREALEG